MGQGRDWRGRFAGGGGGGGRSRRGGGSLGRSGGAKARSTRTYAGRPALRNRPARVKGQRGVTRVGRRVTTQGHARGYTQTSQKVNVQRIGRGSSARSVISARGKPKTYSTILRP